MATSKGKLFAAVGGSVAALVISCVTYFEGTKPQTYRDPVGIPTVCMGHTGPDVAMGQTRTLAECEDILAADLFKHDSDIRRCVDVDKLTDGQHAAFLSFAFNVGAAKFCASTMARLIRQERPELACRELLRWVYAGGKQLAGLVKRRQAEFRMCMGLT